MTSPPGNPSQLHLYELLALRQLSQRVRPKLNKREVHPRQYRLAPQSSLTQPQVAYPLEGLRANLDRQYHYRHAAKLRIQLLAQQAVRKPILVPLLRALRPAARRGRLQYQHAVHRQCPCAPRNRPRKFQIALREPLEISPNRRGRNGKRVQH